MNKEPLLFPEQQPPDETCGTCANEFCCMVCNNTRPVYFHYCEIRMIGSRYRRIRLKDKACGFWRPKEKDEREKRK